MPEVIYEKIKNRIALFALLALWKVKVQKEQKVQSKINALAKVAILAISPKTSISPCKK